MKDLWEGRGYAELKLQKQNLQTLRTVEEVFLSRRNEGEVRNDKKTQQNQDDINAVQNVNMQNPNVEQEIQDTDLDTTAKNGIIEVVNSTNPAYQTLLQSSKDIFFL